jgi:lambda family phage portal protein
MAELSEGDGANLNRVVENKAAAGGVLEVWERALAAIAPGWAAKRAEARLHLSRATMATSLLRNYDANQTSRRNQGWTPTNQSGAAITGADLSRIRARSRELVRNNEWAAKGMAVIEDDVVGTGFAIKFEHKEQAVADRAAAAWAKWADTLEVDSAGLADFSGLLAQVVRGMAEGGDVLIRRRWRKADDGLSVPMQLQLLEGDHLDALKDNVDTTGNRTISGVEHDLLGRRTAYWILRDHPGDNLPTTRESSRVPAEDVLHVFREDRKGQVRGVPWLAPAMQRMRDSAEFEDATIVRVKGSACYMATVQMATAQDGFAQTGTDGRVVEPVDSLKPGLTQYLQPGEEIHFNTPPEVGVDYAEFVRGNLLAVAAGLQIPYEALTGDLRNTSFSSGRLGWLQWQRRIEAYRWRLLVPRVCNPIVAWFLEALAVTDPKCKECTVTWDPPHREMIDPTAEVASAERAIRAGLVSRAEIVRSLGRDPDQVLRDGEADTKAQKAAGVMFSSDPNNDLGRKPQGQPGRKPGEAAN